MNDCRFGNPNNIDPVILNQIKLYIKEHIKDFDKTFLFHQKRLDEMEVCIKNNLSNGLRELFDSMKHSGELKTIITETIMSTIEEIENKTKGFYSIENFGVVGDGIVDNTIAIQQAIDFCYKNNAVLVIPHGIYRTDNLILKCNIKGIGNPIILFNENQGFKNYENNGSKRYKVTEITGVIFESDKSKYFNMNDEVTDTNVIRKYGQRIWIGNKTTAPNNIYSDNIEEMKNGEGWWNKDYSQWIEGGNLNPDDIKSTYANINFKNDTNIINAPHGIVIDKCKFIGFGVGLTLKGTYGSKIVNTEFARCKIGLVTDHAGSLPGKLSDSKSKVTTLYIENNLFDDISFFGIYGESLLQAKIYNNIFQPVGISCVLIAGADNYFYNNYSEIVHIGTLLATNDVKNCKIHDNFTNKEYSKYCAYVRYGSFNEILKHTGNQKCYVAASTENNNFDELLNIEKDNYFYTNGNAIARNKSKFAVFTTTGNGNNFDVEVKKTSRKDGTIPSLRVSQTGIEFNGTEEILSVEVLQDYNNKSLLSYYNIEGNGNHKVIYVEQWNKETKDFERKDLRIAGSKCSFKVAFNDGYKG